MEERRKSWRHQAPHEVRKKGRRTKEPLEAEQEAAAGPHVASTNIWHPNISFFFQERIGDLKDNVFSCLNIYSSARTYFYHIGELTK